MNKLPLPLLAAAMLALSLGLAGCQSRENKDKAAKDSGAKDVTRVKIEVGSDPHKQITVGLGEAAQESIMLKRPAGVTKDLTCSVSGGRDGVKGSVISAKINGDEVDVRLLIQVAMDAKLGQVPLTITAESEGSPFASKMVPVLVRRKTSISAVKPIILKQNQAEIVKATVTLGDDVKEATVTLRVRDKNYKDAVGITAEADKTKLDKSTEITVTVNVAKTAAEGDYRVDISLGGHHSPTQLWSYSRDFDLKVERSMP
jgi:hypothetical protein